MKNVLQSLKKYKAEIFLFFWLMSLLGTVAYKISLFYFQIDHTTYLWISEILFLILILYYLFKEKEFYVLTLFALFVLIKLTGSYLVYENYRGALDFSKDIIKTSFGYSFVFLIFSFLKNIDNKQLNKIFRVYKTLSIIIYTTIFLGVIFSIKMFETYFGSRFGFSGILFPSSYGSYFVVISILIFYFYNRYITTISIKYLLTASLAGLLIGTKSSYLFLLLFWGYFFFENKYYKEKWFWMPLIFIIALFLVFKNQVVDLFKEKFVVLYDLFQNNDFLTFALSYRDVSFQKAGVYIQENWFFLNYLLGGVDRRQLLVEISLADLFLNFGIFGMLLFFVAYAKLILSKLRKDNALKFAFSAILIITIMGGNFFDRFYLAYPLVFLFIICRRDNIYKST